MRNYKLSYGKTILDLNIPDQIQVDLIEPIDLPPLENPVEEVKHSLEHPIGISLDTLVRPSCTVAIAVNDKTRPVPHKYILPPLLEKLLSLGVKKNNIFIYIATGTHLPMDVDEIRSILPREIVDHYQITSHNCDDDNKLRYLGKTTKGTDAYANTYYYKSNIKIVTGNIEPHHFMGYSGGVKSAAIGLAGRQTINTNHAMLIDDNSRFGLFESNPMRQDIEEIGRMMGIDFALNVILNSQKNIARVFSGDPLMVMNSGISLVKEKCQVIINNPYDLVIASAGGYPKDINLYQSQKALTHASAVVRNGGVIIITAECSEGSGSLAFQEFMEGVSSYKQAIEKFSATGFRVGPHKAFQIAREAANKTIILVSNLPSDSVRNWLMTPAPSIEEAMNIALSILPDNPSVAVMPRATNTIPEISVDN